jgi:hypothetical protein
MYKKEKSVKLNLKHLNDCYNVFKEISKQQNITEENESQYIQVLLNSYITSNNIIDDEKIQKYKSEDPIFEQDQSFAIHLKNLRIDNENQII